MDITFSDKNLRKCANDDTYARKRLGALRARLFKQRLDDMAASESLEDLRYMPGKFHELTKNRKGQWACHLDGSYRLIFTPHENPVPVSPQGIFIWAEIKGVEIIEIKDYH